MRPIELAGRGAALAFAMALATPAAAADEAPCGPNLICATEPEKVAAAMRTAGYRAKIEKDSEGDPAIASAASGYNFTVLFYGCEKHIRCDSLQFRATFDKDAAITPSVVNEWNADRRFSQLALKPDGTLMISYDVTTIGGLTQPNFNDVLDWWATTSGELSKFLKSKVN